MSTIAIPYMVCSPKFLSRSAHEDNSCSYGYMLLYTKQENTRSVSTSALPFGSQQEGQKVAKVIINFTATSEKELSINHGEFVQVLNDTRNWWLVENKHGTRGYVPSDMLESVSMKQAKDASMQGKGIPPSCSNTLEYL